MVGPPGLLAGVRAMSLALRLSAAIHALLDDAPTATPAATTKKPLRPAPQAACNVMKGFPGAIATALDVGQYVVVWADLCKGSMPEPKRLDQIREALECGGLTVVDDGHGLVVCELPGETAGDNGIYLQRGGF